MSDPGFPEDTRYNERPEPGNGWRHRLERRLLAWPARYSQRLVRRRFKRLSRRQVAAPDLDQLREQLRRYDLTDESLSLYIAHCGARGLPDADLQGALALAQGLAVQCREPLQQIGMLSAAAGLLVMSGRQVHLLTGDDESARSLAAAVCDELEHLHLGASCVVQGMSLAERRLAWRAPVVVANVREALRDYLEDRLALHIGAGEVGRKLARLAGSNPLDAARTRGLPFGIVVDGNAVLAEQACSPLTLIGSTADVDDRDWARIALHLAGSLSEGQHFQRRESGDIALTDAGEFELSHRAASLPGAWRNAARRARDVCQALTALQLQPGADYQLQEGSVQLDARHERLDGLKQLVEAKEGLALSLRSRVRGKLTFQRFFRRYQQLAALCEDTREIRGELWDIYGMPVCELAPPPAVALSTGELSAKQQRAVKLVSHLGLGDWLSHRLALRNGARERREMENLRRSLLHLDNQAGTVTAFMGQSE